MTIQMIVPFHVSTGNGEKLICKKICKEVEVKIQDVMDIFLIHMEGTNYIVIWWWECKL